eukprot:TRINITY_DN11978_c0_g5_i1.p1 TRINITY_DN11978_c0_g5~~TRINITY_DN11978_c0_g5_i1.p1  ORF type:complete len:650 (-),score=79.70 TRINITY_DN11978_c0_g5_i1:294-2243(-)
MAIREGGRGAATCDFTLVEPRADDDVAADPFGKLKLSPHHAPHDAPPRQDSPAHFAANWSPRRLAKELEILQMFFVAAHEEQVRNLQKLIAANGVEISIVETPTGDLSDDNVKPAGQGSGDEACLPTQKEACKSHEDRDSESSRQVITEGHECAIPPTTPKTCFEPKGKQGHATFPVADEEIAAPTSSSSPAGTTMSSKTARKTLSKSSWVESSMAAARARRSSRFDTSLSDMLNTINSGRATQRFLGRAYSTQWVGSAIADSIHTATEHVYFDLSCGLVIVLNAAFMAYEADHSLTAPLGEPKPAWEKAAGKGFTLFFVCELLLRMCGGLHRFFGTCNTWNYFDFFIVALTVVEEFVQEAASLSNTRMVRLLRLTRTVKVLRIARIVRLVGALRTLVNSLVGTIKQVFWAFFLIACIIFTFAVLFGQMVANARTPETAQESALMTYWGTLVRCVYTLYMSVSGGISWMDAAEPLKDLGTPVVLGFLLYVALIQWVVLNVITACFCESAAEAARKDVSLAVQTYRADRDHFLQRCKAIFKSIDKDGSGKVQAHEMTPYLDTEPARALFAALDIDLHDVHGVFELLDEDGDACIDLEEFMWGCMQLRGGARALGIAQIQSQNRHLSRILYTLADGLNVTIPRGHSTYNGG